MSETTGPARAGRSGRGPRMAIVVVLAVLLVGGLILWRSRPRPAPPPETGPAPVDGVTVGRRDIQIAVDAVGTVTSLNLTAIRPRVDGQLTEVRFKEAQDVKTGELLAVIDPRPYRAALAQAEAQVRKDQALAADLRVNLGRAQQLAALGAGPRQNADTLKAQAEAADATAAADAALAESARLNLQFTSITSPTAGRVGLRQIDPGAIVHAADPNPITTVIKLAPISVIFAAPQAALTAVRDATQVGPVEVGARTDPAHPFVEGRLAAIDNTVDPTTGQIKLRAVYPNADLKLWPGELVSVRVRLRTLANVLSVPDSAILAGPDGPYAYVAGPGGRAVTRPLKVGPASGGYTSILAGLSEGDTVVTHGQSRLKPGSAMELHRQAQGAAVSD